MVLTHVPELQAFAQRAELSGALKDVLQFLLVPDASGINWQIMKDSLDAVVTNATNNPLGSGIGSLRILVTLADGTTAFDNRSSKNTFAFFKTKEVNENHQSRAAIISAVLSASGVAFEKKYSSSTNKNEQYLAIRLGKSAEDAIGVARFSFTA
jgi:hypothetical protein